MGSCLARGPWAIYGRCLAVCGDRAACTIRGREAHDGGPPIAEGFAGLFPDVLGVRFLEAGPERVVADSTCATSTVRRPASCTAAPSWPSPTRSAAPRPRSTCRPAQARRRSNRRPTSSRPPTPARRSAASARPASRPATMVWQTRVLSPEGRCSRSSPRRRWCCEPPLRPRARYVKEKHSVRSARHPPRPTRARPCSTSPMCRRPCW